MWGVTIGILGFLQAYYLVYSTNVRDITEPSRYENCSDPNAEFRFDNASCVVTCSKKTTSENPDFCFGKPLLEERCYCKQNYVLEESTNLCIETEKCPCNTTAKEITRFSNECANDCDTFHTLTYCPGLLRQQCWCIYTHCKNDAGVCMDKEKV